MNKLIITLAVAALTLECEMHKAAMWFFRAAQPTCFHYITLTRMKNACGVLSGVIFPFALQLAVH